MLRTFFTSLASIRLTVALMVLAMILIFVGTLAQAHIGMWQAIDTYFRSFIAWIDPQIFIPRQVGKLPFYIPFPGGMLIGACLLVNLIAAHTLRFKFSARRLGIIVLHAGLIVLLTGEFVTAWFAEEGLMSINVGSQSNYVEDVRSVEFAIVDPSDPKLDRVIAIPEQMLNKAIETGKRIEHQTLPFSIEIDQWLPNSQLMVARGSTQANRGVGREAFAESLPPVRGVDGSSVNAPAAYITLYDDDEPLGTWLLWVNLIDHQIVEIDDKKFGIALRYKRTYKPYTLHLIEFRHDQYIGTQIPHNFSSRVRIDDPSRGTDREVVISMNHPLRYAGATFYQASYKPDNTGTVLQVVRNPGAWLPYLACMMVGGGMMWHFILGLTSFLQKRRKQNITQAKQANASLHKPLWVRLAMMCVGIVGILIAVSSLFSPLPSSEYDLDTFSRLPASAGGRVKPLDTVGRHVLLAAGGRQSIAMEEQKISPTAFLLALIAADDNVKDYPIFRVDHPGVLSLMDLKPEDVWRERITLATVEPHWSEITQQGLQAIEIDSRRRDDFQRAIAQLFDRVSLVLAHSQSLAPYIVPPLSENEQWQPLHDAVIASGLIAMPGMAQPPDPQDIHPAVRAYVEMMTAYDAGDAQRFNAVLHSYDALLRDTMPRVMRRTDHEVFFNRASLFTGATTVYVLAFVLAAISMLLRIRSTKQVIWADRTAEGLRLSAYALVIAAVLVHTIGIAFRIYLQERPPVTSLYSSAVFVGWAAVLLGIVLERIYPIAVATLGSAFVGFVTLIIAHHLGSDGDTMQMMQAVLDSNFWLATHVIVITLGYSATFLAGALAMFYILLGVFTRYLTKERAQMLTRMVYGVVCFALLFSFVGTVLGGIWADQSWGRFWGWDPKENGAALVVLINAIILHARWGGLIRQRGIMTLAVAGNIVTAWSWFGTNMLGIGLHSYGFMDAAVFWLFTFVISQLILISIGLIPLPGWRSQPEKIT